jgi:hypothetical protein
MSDAETLERGHRVGRVVRHASQGICSGSHIG